MTADEKGFLLALKKNPDDTVARGAFADWLDDQGRQYEAILQRGKAGLSEVYFKIRRKSDGLFAENHSSKPEPWTTKGKMWRKLGDLRGHLTAHARRFRTYTGNTAWADLEVVVVEVRVVEGVVLPVRTDRDRKAGTRRVTVAEPVGGTGTPAPEE